VINPGESVSVDLRISELGDDILTAFDPEISFDDSILGFDSFDTGTGLDTFGLDFGAFSYGFDLGGIAAIGDLSLDTDVTLRANQPNSFILGTLDFSALGLGISSLDIGFSIFAGELDANFNATELQADIESGSITVIAPPSAVSAPAAIWLFGIGLVGLMGFSKRKPLF
jgi:hypothetical protein